MLASMIESIVQEKVNESRSIRLIRVSVSQKIHQGYELNTRECASSYTAKLCGQQPTTTSKKRIIESGNNGVNYMTRDVYLDQDNGIIYMSRFNYYE